LAFWGHTSRLRAEDMGLWVIIFILGFSLSSLNNRLNYQDRSNYDKYLVSIYWAICTLSTVGFGDVHAYNNGNFFSFFNVFIWKFNSWIYSVYNMDDIRSQILFIYHRDIIRYDRKFPNQVHIFLTIL